jgi:phosphate-selective porin OprO/OprP
MKLSRLSLAITAILGSSLSTAALAIDLYVDTKTEQLYAKPGPGRVHIGSFVREDTPKTAGKTADNTTDKTETAANTGPIAAEKTETADLSAVRRDIELKSKMMGARLASDIASLEERVKET